MLKEIPLLRAPENNRTGMEINPNVRYPDQTEAAISSPQSSREAPEPRPIVASVTYQPTFDARSLRPVIQRKSTTGWGRAPWCARAGIYQVGSKVVRAPGSHIVPVWVCKHWT